MNSVIDPAVLLDPDKPTPSVPAQTAMKGRLAKDAPPGESCSSAITDMKVDGGNLVLMLARNTDADKATNPKNYMVMVNGSTFLPRADDIVFDPHSGRVTFQRLPLRPGDHVGVTVMGLWDANPDIPAASITCHMQIPKRHRRLVGFSALLAFVLLVGVIAVMAYLVR